ncbi:MAG: alpha-mannosidase [Thermotogae bacterium]|nr:alpha-mannosidase [Thermotogota bacterium]
MSEKIRVHLIANAHIDPVWLWRWPEGVNEIISTCQSASSLMREYPELTFTKGESACYEWIEKISPELFETIKQQIRENRWEIVNGWIVQPDCNIPSGESFIRQSLYGKKFFKAKLETDTEVGYCVDSFGHSASFPGILKGSGYKYYIFMRPGPHEKDLPQAFIWKWKDGSEILTFRIHRTYATHSVDDLKKLLDYILNNIQPNVPVTICFYGVGNHGGGPTREQIEFLMNLKEASKDVEYIFSTPERFFKELEKYSSFLPVVEDELQYHSIGCYTSNSKIKKLNRRAENMLQASETWAAISAFLTDFTYPGEKFEDSWKTLLFNQFHDTLAGTAIKEAYDDAYEQFGKVISTSSDIMYEALFKIINNIDTQGDGIPFIVFNNSCYENDGYIEFEPWMGHIEWKDSLSIVDSKSEKKIYQLIPHSALVRNKYRIVFKDVIPPFGYKVYWIRETNGKNEYETDLRMGEDFVENEYYKLEIRETGINLYDKWKERYVIQNHQFVIIEDHTDTWSHGIDRYLREHSYPKFESIEKLAEGPLKSVFKVNYRFNDSEIDMFVTLHSKDPVVKIRYRINWHEKFKLVKLYSKINYVPKVLSEIPYGVIEREANGKEYPMQRFIMLEEPDKEEGITIINNGKYGYDVLDDEVRISILRSIPYAWHDPYKIPDKEYFDFLDIGTQEFEMWFFSYNENNKYNVFAFAEQLNKPYIALNVWKHDGTFPPTNSFLSVFSEDTNVWVAAIKGSEKKPNEEIVLRILELKGIGGNVELEFVDKKFLVKMKPFEIKTCTISKNGTLIETNHIEKNNT